MRENSSCVQGLSPECTHRIALKRISNGYLDVSPWSIDATGKGAVLGIQDILDPHLPIHTLTRFVGAARIPGNPGGHALGGGILFVVFSVELIPLDALPAIPQRVEIQEPALVLPIEIHAARKGRYMIQIALLREADSSLRPL
jgi:hypothetical protein